MFNSIKEAYNQTVEFLEKQGTRSVDDNRLKTCLYLSKNGNKCAVGAWIPDGHPAQTLSGNVESLLDAHPDLFEENGPLFIKGLTTPETVIVWQFLQKIHDKSTSLNEMNENLLNFANCYRLPPLALTAWDANCVSIPPIEMAKWE